MFTSTHDDEIEELRRRLEAAEAEKASREKEAASAIRKAQRVAGQNHTRFTLALYELLEIEAEHSGTRVVNGASRSVATDKDESLRTERTFTFIEGLLEKAKAADITALREQDEAGREERRPKPKDAEVSVDETQESDEETIEQEDAEAPYGSLQWDGPVTA